MNWSRLCPTEVGFYWLWDDRFEDYPVIVEVYIRGMLPNGRNMPGAGLYVAIPCVEGTKRLKEIADGKGHDRWIGPLPLDRP